MHNGSMVQVHFKRRIDRFIERSTRSLTHDRRQTAEQNEKAHQTSGDVELEHVYYNFNEQKETECKSLEAKWTSLISKCQLVIEP